MRKLIALPLALLLITCADTPNASLVNVWDGTNYGVAARLVYTNTENFYITASNGITTIRAQCNYTATDTTISYTNCTGDTGAQGNGTETYSIFGNTLTIVSGGIRFTFTRVPQ